MRRQAKPFVTEYRASSRRGKDGSHPSGRTERETVRPSEPSSDLFAAPFNAPATAPSSEDSYEAALRAADALFSSPRSTPPKAVEPPPVAAAAPRPATAAEAVFAPPPLAPERTSTAPEMGGRILQAIDVPDVDRFAELEAERAPKRRGRKPGSKNKPKIPALLAASVAPASPKPMIDPVRAYQTPIEVQPATRPALLSSANGAAPAVLPSFRLQTSSSAANKSKDRFAWVRTKLGPGEKWKRRLPKVAW